ncbi:hypothetical protein Q8F55_006152 [Vanrija albida]|uniref:Rhodopsin domain-containing protein n=1 Tax=Vanrija albida TaxID=181172 RepID=A0ABR3PWA3_9TREE
MASVIERAVVTGNPRLDNRSPAVLIVTSVFLAIATIFVSLRCVSKFYIRKRADWDDWVTLLAWLFTVALSTCIIFAATVGMGKADYLIKPEWIRPLKTATYAFPMFYNLSSMTAKTAVLLLYVRMASAHPFLRNASYAVLAIVNVTGLILVFLNIFQCRPINAAWNMNVEGTCMDTVTLFLASSPVNILSDVAILILPLPIITSLRMEIHQKIGLVLTFICLIFVAIVDVVRISFLQTALRQQISIGMSHVSANSRPPNYYYDVAYGTLWSAIECSVRVSCASALVLKPLMQKLKPTILSRSSKTKSNSNGHAGSGHNSNGNPLDSNNGMGNGNDKDRDSIKSSLQFTPKSPKIDQMPLQAILETDPDVADEDTMDIFDLFRSGPPAQASTGNSAIAAAIAQSGGTAIFGTGFGGNIARIPSRRLSGGAMVAPLARMPSRGGIVAPLGRIPSGGRRDSFGPQPGPSPNPTNGSPHSSETIGLPLAPQRTKLSDRTILHPLKWLSRDDTPMEQVQQPTGKFFDFVQMGGRKPLTELSAKEAWWPVLFVSILFFLWGFAYGLLGTLNSRILDVIGSSPSKAIALQSSYWIGYAIGPSTLGGYVLIRHGFKATFITGLAVYACGTMCFWPSSVLASYPGFFISNFIIACGLSILEVAANPFIALAGPGEYSESRLNFSQGIQGIGGVLSPILARKALFRNVEGRASLFDVQWCYLAVALFVLALALVFFYVPLSEATEDDMEREAQLRLANAGLDPRGKAYGMSAKWFIIVFGVFCMSSYLGAQESVSYFWEPLLARFRPRDDEFWDLTIGHSVFAFARFLASGAMFIGFTPRLILNICLIGSFITTLLVVVLPSSQGTGAYVCLLLNMFLEAPVFPTVFATALRGAGRHTKPASIALTVAIGVGACVWESVTYGAWRAQNKDIHKAIVVVPILFGLQAFYSLTLTANVKLRRWVDPFWSRPAAHGPSELTFGTFEHPEQLEPDYGKQPALCKTELAVID